VLEDDWDPNYEPGEKEILEYAEFLGLDMEKDKDLLWIAREGLKAPLPEPWKPCKTDDGSSKVYYFNFNTGASIWEHPCDIKYKKLFEEEKAKRDAAATSAPANSKLEEVSVATTPKDKVNSGAVSGEGGVTPEKKVATEEKTKDVSHEAIRQLEADKQALADQVGSLKKELQALKKAQGASDQALQEEVEQLRTSNAILNKQKSAFEKEIESTKREMNRVVQEAESEKQYYEQRLRSNKSVNAGSQADGEEQWDEKMESVTKMMRQVKSYLQNQGTLVEKMQASLR
jgi:hypothetical protein